MGNSEDGKDYPRENLEPINLSIISKTNRNLGTGGIKFEQINLPVDIKWQIKDIIKSQGTMVGGEKIIRDEGSRAIKAIVASHEFR